ncbi:MAG TPA: hypothetical protein VFZ65_09310, partial [Planctomycetota bacterium]|nr:hypothetical protein [Planctomycetota bacterium]
MNHTLFPAVATTFVTLASLLSAQSSLSAQAAPRAFDVHSIRTPIHSLPDDEGVPYGIWAAGDAYKVAFDGGMRFVPYAGSDVQPAPTWSWRTVSARVGELELATAAAPRLTHGDWRAEYDLGGLIEAYDVRADGVEQTFVLRERPASGGDFVLRGAVTSSLQPLAGEGRNVSYVDAGGKARVCYGAATAVDAAGRRTTLGTTVVDGGLELRLDGGWLEGAVFPLVVDPLLTAVTVGSGAQVTEVAVEHDGSFVANVWYAEVRVTGTDHDLRLFRT